MYAIKARVCYNSPVMLGLKVIKAKLARAYTTQKPCITGPLLQTREFVAYFKAKFHNLTSLLYDATNFITIVDCFIIFH